MMYIHHYPSISWFPKVFSSPSRSIVRSNIQMELADFDVEVLETLCKDVALSCGTCHGKIHGKPLGKPWTTM
jgi:hypothetical protein